MILARWPSGVTLKSRLITADSGPDGIAVLTTNLERTKASLAVPAEDAAMLPQSAREIFTLNVELPGIHPFGRRCIHCQATLSSVLKAAEGTLAVAIAIHKMRFIAAPQRAMYAGASDHRPGGERIQ
jgi:hypothetical protein